MKLFLLSILLFSFSANAEITTNCNGVDIIVDEIEDILEVIQEFQQNNIDPASYGKTFCRENSPTCDTCTPIKIVIREAVAE